jgi:hypothetical protein
MSHITPKIYLNPFSILYLPPLTQKNLAKEINTLFILVFRSSVCWLCWQQVLEASQDCSMLYLTTGSREVCSMRVPFKTMHLSCYGMIPTSVGMGTRSVLVIMGSFSLPRA